MMIARPGEKKDEKSLNLL